MSKLARIKLLYITSVKVITLTITQKNTTDFDASVTDMNSTDHLETSIVDKTDRSQCFNRRDKLDRTVQIGHGTHTRIACMYAIYSEHMCYNIALTSLGLRKPRERVKFKQPYLSEKVTCSFY